MDAAGWAAFLLVAFIYVAIGGTALALVICSGRHSRAEEAAESTPDGSHDLDESQHPDERAAEVAWLRAKFDASVDVVPGRETGERR